MKLRFYGTCSGTEPMHGCNHTSFSAEVGDRLYLFDAGEHCGHNAYLFGANPVNTKAIFISHCHLDHTAGLPGWLGVMAKLGSRTGRRAAPFKVFMPRPEVWEAVSALFAASEGCTPAEVFGASCERVRDGVFYDDGIIKVTALHNSHLQEREKPGEHLSYSFRIESGGKAVVFSGDTRTYAELYPLFEGGCDLALCETGHHVPADVAAALEGKTGAIGFIHHGRRMLANAESEVRFAREKFSGQITVFRDGDAIRI